MSLRRFWLTRRLWKFVEKMRFGASYSTNKLLLIYVCPIVYLYVSESVFICVR